MCAMFGWLSEARILSFALESSEPVSVRDELIGQHFERNFAPQLRVAGAVHFAHSAGPQLVDHFVRTET